MKVKVVVRLTVVLLCSLVLLGGALAVLGSAGSVSAQGSTSPCGDALDTVEGLNVLTLTVDPEATNALYQIGRTGVISGENLDRAIAALQQYLTTEPPAGQPTLANAHWRLGMCYELKGELDKARSEFEAALALNPNDESAQKSLDNLGKPEETQQ